MAKLTFTIVYSNYTGAIFAWGGMPQANRKYLGNREILGSVEAKDDKEALEQWRSKHP
jgi:hypothetical protein